MCTTNLLLFMKGFSYSHHAVPAVALPVGTKIASGVVRGSELGGAEDGGQSSRH